MKRFFLLLKLIGWQTVDLSPQASEADPRVQSNPAETLRTDSMEQPALHVSRPICGNLPQVPDLKRVVATPSDFLVTEPAFRV